MKSNNMKRFVRMGVKQRREEEEKMSCVRGDQWKEETDENRKRKSNAAE